jgi:tetratricopeptide (TPR) repeat protein
VSQLSDGFVRPRFDAEVIMSYYEASLACEMIEEQRGSTALVAMLKAYRDGLDTPAVFAKVLGMKPEEVDKQFDAWLRAKFAVPLRSIQPSNAKGEVGGAFVSAMRAGVALISQNQPDSAQAVLLRAQALFPEYAGQGAPAMLLAKIALDRGDLRTALQQVQRVTSRNETAWDANLLEADLRTKLGDSTGARVPLERMLWISPYDIVIHNRLAELAARAGDHATALRERRAVVALDSPDPLDARYQLARELAASGDVTGARRELLGVLEQAPSFEKAQALLLDLRNRNAQGGKP